MKHKKHFDQFQSVHKSKTEKYVNRVITWIIQMLPGAYFWINFKFIFIFYVNSYLDDLISDPFIWQTHWQPTLGWKLDIFGWSKRFGHLLFTFDVFHSVNRLLNSVANWPISAQIELVVLLTRRSDDYWKNWERKNYWLWENIKKSYQVENFINYGKSVIWYSKVTFTDHWTFDKFWKKDWRIKQTQDFHWCCLEWN